MFSKLLGEVRGIFNILTIIDLVISTLFIVFGIIFFSNQNMNITALSILTGLLLLGNGVFSIFSYLKRGTIVLYNNNLIYGIILGIVGIISMFVSVNLKVLLGLYLLVLGIQRINYGIFFKKYHESSWIVTLVIGILYIIMGLLAFFTSRDNVVNVSSICILGYGLINFVNVILLRRRSKYFIA